MEIREIIGTKIKEVVVGEKTIVLILEKKNEACVTPNTIDNYVPMRKKRKKTGLLKGEHTKGKFTPEIKDEARKLRKTGMKLKDIAEFLMKKYKFKVDKSSVSNWTRGAKEKVPAKYSSQDSIPKKEKPKLRVHSVSIVKNPPNLYCKIEKVKEEEPLPEEKIHESVLHEAVTKYAQGNSANIISEKMNKKYNHNIYPQEIIDAFKKSGLERI